MPTYYSPEGTFRFYLETVKSAGWMATQYSSGFFGVVFGATADETAESWILACRSQLLLDPQSPDDVLPVIALDRGLPRFSTETAVQHRDRLWNAWEIYLEAGSEEVIEKQAQAAGWGPDVFMGAYGDPDVSYGDPEYFYRDRGVYVDYRQTAKGPRGQPAPYRTQFWLVFNYGFHPVTAGPIPWGDFVWGDTSPGVWGPQGYTRAFARDMTDMVLKWKPSNYAFRGFTFIINSIDYGDPDVDYGDPDILYGGAIEVPYHPN